MSTTTLFDIRTYERNDQPRKLVRDLPPTDQPDYRFRMVGKTAVSSAELLAVILGTPDALDLAGEILSSSRTLDGLARMTTKEMERFRGVGEKKALQLQAAIELGRRAFLAASKPEELPKVTCPADAANFLIPQMMHLEQEHLVVMTLNTRNCVVGTNTIYKGSVNSSVVRLAEIFRPAIRDNCPAIIVAHNHPSGDPSPSPEDVNVTRQLVQMGKQLDISVLDHVIIGRGRYVSLKERALGFD